MLEYHQKIKDDGFEIPVLPAFRPDNAMNAGNALKFNAYVKKLEAVTDITVLLLMISCMLYKTVTIFFNGLSIILSKAFLLADDDKITDSTIFQIDRK